MNKEFEKIIEELEELKAIKDGCIPIIHGKAELELHDKAIRTKAIDDLLKDANEMSIQVNTGTYTMAAIGIGLLEQIAEELKVGK